MISWPLLLMSLGKLLPLAPLLTASSFFEYEYLEFDPAPILLQSHTDCCLILCCSCPPGSLVCIWVPSEPKGQSSEAEGALEELCPAGCLSHGISTDGSGWIIPGNPWTSECCQWS